MDVVLCVEMETSRIYALFDSVFVSGVMQLHRQRAVLRLISVISFSCVYGEGITLTTVLEDILSIGTLIVL